MYARTSATNTWPRRVIITFAISMVIYCLTVIGFVTTSPDIGVRCLLIGRAGPDSLRPGIEIQSLPSLNCLTNEPPANGSILLRVGEQPMRTYRDFPAALEWLRSAVPSGQPLYAGTNPYLTGEPIPRPVIAVEGIGTFVEIEYLAEGDPDVRRTYLQINSLPWSTLAQTMIWFALQLALTSLAGLAYWHRPFDNASRMFFLMTLVTMGAFVGGFHWWVIASNFWLNFPFVACAALVPVLLLNFFLIYPRSDSSMPRWLSATTRLIYVPAAVAIIFFVMTLWELQSESSAVTAVASTQRMTQSIVQLQHGINAYLCLSATYFVWTVFQLIRSYVSSRNPLEQRQLWWMLCAGIFAAIPVGYTLYLALYDRSSFALGYASVPMFLASLSFMVAYLVGMIRYKLLLIDQFVDKGMWFYVVSSIVAVLFGMIMAGGGLVSRTLNTSPQPKQVLAVFLTTVMVTVILLWIRDRVQRIIDRRFFREKYQLDQLLVRVNRTVGDFVDQQTLSQRLILSCRDVLRVTWAAFYLRDRTGAVFQLVNVSDGRQIELQIAARPELTALLKEETTWQREQGRWREDSPIQNLLHVLKADLIQTLTVEGDVLGLVALGPRIDQSTFSAEDVTFLQALSHVTTVALQAARIHQNLNALNEELQTKTEQLTSQQRQITVLQTELAQQQSIEAAVSSEVFHRGAIKGNSPALRKILEMAKKAALSDATILIRGESGCGKELLALAIHENSPRAKGPLVPVHCAALSPTLLESELFGHVKGAFTGANQDRIGRFEMARGGTLFLDEIGDITPETQIKLLRVLQQRCFEPVGSSRTVDVDVRLIAATHRSLEQLMTTGQFREDLFYRLNVVALELPPLRDRPDDIFELIWHFLKRACHRTGKPLLHISPDVVKVLENYPWPGNIRELENVIERAVVLSEGNSLTMRELPEVVLVGAKYRDERAMNSDGSVGTSVKKPARVQRGTTSNSSAATLPSVTTDTSPRDVITNSANEREILQEALQSANGNLAQAARALGVPRSTFYSRLKKYGIR
ncbi:MAG: sigma 54-interacting transcriptional regulator [Planctomycetota bacterium]|nr:sigma 54-interacting transcriptional regulator [Planctomycetota bacterium]MDA1211293.1 sigma 54-interacting transcriptional regulator [Planctomycetota bacterium]